MPEETNHSSDPQQAHIQRLRAMFESRNDRLLIFTLRRDHELQRALKEHPERLEMAIQYLERHHADSPHTPHLLLILRALKPDDNPWQRERERSRDGDLLEERLEGIRERRRRDRDRDHGYEYEP